MFAIYGIQVIGGQLARCNDQDPQRYTVRVRNPKSPAVCECMRTIFISDPNTLFLF